MCCCGVVNGYLTTVLVVQRCRSAWKAVVNFSVLTRTVYQQAGDVMVTMTVMIHQMKLVVVSSILNYSVVCHLSV